MTPRASSRAGSAAWERRNVPVRFTSITRRHSSGVTSPIRRENPMPATLANTWRAPCAVEHGADGAGALERIADVAHHAAFGLDEVAPHHRRSFFFQPVRHGSADPAGRTRHQRHSPFEPFHLMKVATIRVPWHLLVRVVSKCPIEIRSRHDGLASGYASAFELPIGERKFLTPEQWARATFEGAPALLRVFLTTRGSTASGCGSAHGPRPITCWAGRSRARAPTRSRSRPTRPSWWRRTSWS